MESEYKMSKESRIRDMVTINLAISHINENNSIPSEFKDIIIPLLEYRYRACDKLNNPKPFDFKAVEAE